MNTEGEFNAFITKEIRMLGQEYKAIKLSDRFRIGLPDWIMIYKGRTIAVEAKFVKKTPTKGRLLNHPITAPQLSSLKSMALAGCGCWGLIANGETRRMAAVALTGIPETGNFSCDLFTNEMNRYVFLFDFTQTHNMLRTMFAVHTLISDKP